MHIKMSKVGIDLLSAQKQVIGVEVSEEIATFLSNETLLSQMVAESRNTKLSWLSAWRGVFESQIESCSRRVPWGYMKILKKLIVITEDPFVVYEAQKTLLAIMKVESIEEGLTLIEEVLMTSSCIETLTYYLEICRDLLSKTNPHCCFFLSKVQPALNHVGNMCNIANNKQVTNQFLYQYVSIFYKISKLANIFQTDDICRSVCYVNLRNSSLLLNLLFSTSIGNFVKRKLLLTLYYIVKPSSYLLKTTCSTNTSLKEISVEKYLLELAEKFEQKLSSTDMKSIFLRFGQMTSFVGDEMEKGDKSVVDRIRLREWCILSLGMAAILLKGSGHIASDFILKLDNCVKEGLGMEDSVLFPWLPDIFADQDDMWIDALLLLLELGSSSKGSLELDNHWYFLQFSSTIAFDHLVLIDLLTSPETCFLDYLIRYLKYILKSWPDFVKTVKKMETSQIDREDSADSDIASESGDNAKEKEDEAEMEHKPSMCELEVDILNSGNADSMVQRKSGICRTGAIHTTLLTNVSDGFGSVDGETQHRAAVEEQYDRAGYRNSCTLTKQDSMAYSTVNKHSGLGMIMDTYSDTDSETNDSSSVKLASTLHVNHEVCETAFKHASHLKDNVIDTPGSTELPNTQINWTPLRISSDTELVEMSAGFFSDHQMKHQNNDETEFDEFDNDNTDESTGRYSDFYYSDVNHYTATVNTEKKDSDLMDRVIGMFIRVMLKLQRMGTHRIIVYDPKPLLKLLSEVEALYVQVAK